MQLDTGLHSTADDGVGEVANIWVPPLTGEPTSITLFPSGGLLDLSRQQRNLLLLRPVFQLERDKCWEATRPIATRCKASIPTI